MRRSAKFKEKDIADDSTYGLLDCNGSRHGGWSGPRSKKGMKKDKDWAVYLHDRREMIF